MRMDQHLLPQTQRFTSLLQQTFPPRGKATKSNK